jgi:hypothetical protein
VARFAVPRDRPAATAKRHFVTARESDASRPYIFARFPYETDGARRLTETWPYYFRAISYENRAAERLAAESPYETSKIPYENTSRGLYFENAGERRAVFSYRTLEKLYGRVAGRRLAVVFSYGNAEKS